MKEDLYSSNKVNTSSISSEKSSILSEESIDLNFVYDTHNQINIQNKYSNGNIRK